MSRKILRQVTDQITTPRRKKNDLFTWGVAHAFNPHPWVAEASLVYTVSSETANSYVERLCPTPPPKKHKINKQTKQTEN